MISYLNGTILKKTEKAVILNTGHVGYLVHLSTPSLKEITESQEKEFFIHSQIREDAFDLYGFETYSDLTFFKSLINVNGIGPKVALEILSVPTDKIKAAIINEDSAFISKIPGIGPKTSKRLILELKGKVEVEDLGELYKEATTDINQDAIDALIKLGYQRNHVTKALKEAPKELIEAEALITYFLKNI